MAKSTQSDVVNRSLMQRHEGRDRNRDEAAAIVQALKQQPKVVWDERSRSYKIVYPKPPRSRRKKKGRRKRNKGKEKRSFPRPGLAEQLIGRSTDFSVLTPVQLSSEVQGTPRSTSCYY